MRAALVGRGALQLGVERRDVTDHRARGVEQHQFDRSQHPDLPSGERHVAEQETGHSPVAAGEVEQVQVGLGVALVPSIARLVLPWAATGMDGFAGNIYGASFFMATRAPRLMKM